MRRGNGGLVALSPIVGCMRRTSPVLLVFAYFFLESLIVWLLLGYLGVLKTLAVLGIIYIFGFIMAARNLAILRRTFTQVNAAETGNTAGRVGPMQQLANASFLAVSIPLYALPGVVPTLAAILISNPLTRGIAYRVMSKRIRTRIEEFGTRSYDNFGNGVRIMSFGPNGFDSSGFGGSGMSGSDFAGSGFDPGITIEEVWEDGTPRAQSSGSAGRTGFSFGPRSDMSAHGSSGDGGTIDGEILEGEIIDAEVEDLPADSAEFDREVAGWLDSVSPEDFVAGGAGSSSEPGASEVGASESKEESNRADDTDTPDADSPEPGDQKSR